MLPKIHLQLFEPQEEQSPTVARILRQRMVSQHLSQFLEVVAVSQVFRYHDLDWHLRLLHSPAHQQWKQDALLLVHMLFEFVPDVLEELDYAGLSPCLPSTRRANLSISGRSRRCISW